MRVVPFRNTKKKNTPKKKKDHSFGRLKGIIEIVGDPDDLIKAGFPTRRQ